MSPSCSAPQSSASSLTALGDKPVMLLGPLFGLAAVIMTPFSMTISTADWNATP